MEGNRAAQPQRAAAGGRRRSWLVGLTALAALGGCGAGAERASSGATSSVTTGAGTTDPAPAPEGERSAGTQGAASLVQVRAVVDGDTFTLADGRRVRLAQVDAPEVGACFGPASTAALRSLVEGEAVVVRRPSNGPEVDAYGRTLGEVNVGHQSVNERLVTEGAASWYREFAAEDPELADRLRAAEDEAKAAKRGLWSACSNAAPAAAKPPVARAVTPPVATAATPPVAKAVVPSRSGCHPAYPATCIPPAPPDLDCADLKRKVEVERSQGDPHRLDADGDGWGCESYG